MVHVQSPCLYFCVALKKNPVKWLFQSIFIMVILKKCTECTKTTFKNVYKYTLNECGLNMQQSAKSRFLLQNLGLVRLLLLILATFFYKHFISIQKKMTVKYLRRREGDANNPNYNPAFIHLQSAFCQNHNSSAFKT